MSETMKASQISSGEHRNITSHSQAIKGQYVKYDLPSFIPLSSSMPEVPEYMRSTMDIISTSTSSQDEMSRYMITRLEHIKAKTPAEHEDIIATAKHDKSGHTVRLLFGRFKGHNHSTKAKFSIFRSEVSSVASSSLTSNARDIVRNLPENFDISTESVIERIFIPNGDSLPLLYLIFIVETVHALAPEYSIYKRQCYWFAMMVMGISMLQGGKVQAIHKKVSDSRWQTVPRLQLPPDPSAMWDDDTESAISTLPIKPAHEQDMKILKERTGAGTIYGVRITRVHTKGIWRGSLQARSRYEVKLRELFAIREQHDLALAQARDALKEELKREMEAERRQDVARLSTD